MTTRKKISSTPTAFASWNALAYRRFWGVLLGVLAFDQLTKLWVLGNLPLASEEPNAGICLIPNVLYFVHVHNHGAAWGHFSGYGTYLALLGIIVLGFMYAARRLLELDKPILQYAFGLLAGGIVGNLIDRLWHGHVIDFIDVYLPGYHWPTFNIADSAITIGMGIYLLTTFGSPHRGRRQEQNTQSSRHKKGA